MPWWSYAVVLTSHGLALLYGYWLGRRHQQQVCDEEAERMYRIEPPSRTPGQPTNLDSPPSEPRSPKWRAGQFKSGPPHTG